MDGVWGGTTKWWRRYNTHFVIHFTICHPERSEAEGRISSNSAAFPTMCYRDSSLHFVPLWVTRLVFLPTPFREGKGVSPFCVVLQNIALRVVKHYFLRTKALLSFPHCLHCKYTIPAKRLSSISVFFFKKMKLFFHLPYNLTILHLTNCKSVRFYF